MPEHPEEAHADAGELNPVPSCREATTTPPCRRLHFVKHKMADLFAFLNLVLVISCLLRVSVYVDLCTNKQMLEEILKKKNISAKRDLINTTLGRTSVNASLSQTSSTGLIPFTSQQQIAVYWAWGGWGRGVAPWSKHDRWP